jgi:hypothetical protein
LIHVQSAGYDSSSSANVIETIAMDYNGTDGYNISLSHFEDYKCNGTAVIEWLNDQLLADDGHSLSVVLDATCPDVSLIINNAAASFNNNSTLFMSYTPFTRDEIPRQSFCFYPSLTDIDEYLFSLLRAFNWRRLTIVVDEGLEYLAGKINGSNKLDVLTLRRETDFSMPNIMFHSVILLVVEQHNLEDIICNSPSGYPDNIYIIPYWYDMSILMNLSCELNSALNYSLIMSFNPPQSDWDNMTDILNDVLSMYARDATNTILGVINATIHDNDDNGTNFKQSLEMKLESIDKQGVTGIVEFINRERPISSVSIYQYRIDADYNKTLIKIGTISNDENFTFTFEMEQNISTVLPDVTFHQSIHISVTVIFYALAVIGLIGTLICFIFTMTFREKKVIKLDSPHLNYLIIVGAVIMYISLFFQAVPALSTISPTVITIACNASSVAIIGVSMLMGTIQGKMFRIFYIFHKPSPSKKKIKDWHIALYVFIITGISSVGVVLQWTVPVLRRTSHIVTNLEMQPIINGLGVSMVPTAYACTEVNIIGGSIRAFVISVSVVVMQVIALIFSFLNYKVDVKALNDTRAIKAIIIVNTFTLVVFLVILALLLQYPTILTVVASFFFFFNPSITLALVFVPKMINLYRDPEGKQLFTTSHKPDNSHHFKSENEENNNHTLNNQTLNHPAVTVQ